MQDNIPFMLDCWANRVVHLLLLKSSMPEPIDSPLCADEIMRRLSVLLWLVSLFIADNFRLSDLTYLVSCGQC